ncbi:hypothetical protein L596_003164 [Steinernema carpocapsae]|uniref:Uncharacterized protein n=1 Tax=Steinernema carpocapsae TaxID=34508 RepID=A0A4U8URQ8_STECR|nr:hypothetical protein L596_003164 [Steinernema carpocapsae]
MGQRRPRLCPKKSKPSTQTSSAGRDSLGCAGTVIRHAQHLPLLFHSSKELADLRLRHVCNGICSVTTVLSKLEYPLI